MDKKENKVKVYVISKDGEVLVPTSRPGKVRRLLRDGQAKVMRREPFTIKLLYEPETNVVDKEMAKEIEEELKEAKRKKNRERRQKKKEERHKNNEEQKQRRLEREKKKRRRKEKTNKKAMKQN